MRQYRNFGMANPEGYRKALRLMKQAEKFNIPIVCFVDTPGAFPGIEAEERGQGEAIARNLLEMSRLKVPTIVFIIGEGASGGALGIGIGDRVYMLENTWYSVISPESCSSILWRSWEYKKEAAEALKLTAPDMKKLKLIDEIIKEANEYLKKGVYGFDLLGYRYTGNAVELNERFVLEVNAPVCIAGSVNGYERLDELKNINPWSFTIGSAFFENKFDGSFEEQINKVCEYVKQ